MQRVHLVFLDSFYLRDSELDYAEKSCCFHEYYGHPYTLTDLTLSQRRPISYRNQSIDMQSKSLDWFLYDIGLHRERVN